MFVPLCATQTHKRKMQSLYPEKKDVIKTMKEYVYETQDLNIADPWGYSLETSTNITCAYKHDFHFIFSLDGCCENS